MRLRIRSSEAAGDSTLSTRESPVTAFPAAIAARTLSETPKPTAGVTHTVRKGETLATLAARHGVTVESLRRINQLASTRVIVGQRIQLPA